MSSKPRALATGPADVLVGAAKLSIDRPHAVPGERRDLPIRESCDLEREQLALAWAQLGHARKRGARCLLALTGAVQILDQLGPREHAGASGDASIESIVAPLNIGEPIGLMDRDRAEPSEELRVTLGLAAEKLRPRKRAGVIDQRV